MKRTLATFYTVLGFSLAAAHAAEPSAAPTRDTATQAWLQLQRGLGSGDWKPFFDLLSDDVVIWFPANEDINRWLPAEELRYRVAKERSMDYFRKLSAGYKGGIRVDEVIRISSGAATVVYEARVQSNLPDGSPFFDRIAVSFDVCGPKICAYRQYFGSERAPAS